MNFHSKDHSVENLNMNAFNHNAKAIAHAVATYVRTLRAREARQVRPARDFTMRERSVVADGHEHWAGGCGATLV